MADLTALKNIFNEHTETPLLCLIEAVSGIKNYDLVFPIDADVSRFTHEKDIKFFMNLMRDCLTSAYEEEGKYTWLYREMARELHPVIESLLKRYGEYWFDVLTEWPHVSEDGQRLAYTRSVKHGVDDRQTVTSLGKYLARVFAGVPDNILRDEAALFVPDVFKIVNTTEEMIHGVNNGPHSCMAWGERRSKESTHPYACYAPENGWSLALRLHNDTIVGRCLCHESDKRKIFVRSYKTHTSSNSPTDTALEAWLKRKGFVRRTSWDFDCQIKIYHGEHEERVFPYIDGEDKYVNEQGFIRHQAEFKCNQTDGNAAEETDEDDHIGTCNHCGCGIHEDDDGHTWVGEHDETLVCDDCCNLRYTYVRGRGGHEYYILDQYAVSRPATCENYDPDYLDYYGLVIIEGDAYKVGEDDICCIGGEWCLIYDDIVALTIENPDTGDTWGFKDDCWQDKSTGDWYSNNTAHIEIDGEMYHPESEFALEHAEKLIKAKEEADELAAFEAALVDVLPTNQLLEA